jgi:broad specificity polyphosphatase/5'/3'-nucleotidase SurE
MNEFDELAKGALEGLRREIDTVISGINNGETYNSSYIDGAMAARLLHAREALALARYSDDMVKVFDRK